MYIVVDVKYMHTNFGGCGNSSFGYIATFHNCQISLYSQWSSKNLIVWNWLKKFMQVWIDVKFMYTNFGGCGFFGSVSEILLLSKTTKLPFLTMDYSPWSSKNLIIWNRLKKFMQVKVNILCMHTNFDGFCHFGFEDIATFKTTKFPFPTMDYYSPQSSKNLFV